MNKGKSSRVGLGGHILIIGFALALCGVGVAQERGAVDNLMPKPAKVNVGEGALVIDGSLAIDTSACKDDRVVASAARTVDLILREAGLLRAPKTKPVLTVRCGAVKNAIQQAVEDESYTITVDSQGGRLEAATPYGALRGLATVAQLVDQAPSGFVIRGVKIEDQPRFPWRGMLIDSCRHFMPTDVIKRNLDGMAAVKMNVLHWHLTEDQGFRVESKRFPKLHQMGSDGLFYTQAQIKEIISYARERGIRVVPEFDMPGHTQAWLAGHPEIAAMAGPFEIERKWGVFDPVMDPTKEVTYTLLDGFLTEMADLFPDLYMHIGGDEVNGVAWNGNAKITEYKKTHKIETNEALHAMFNRRVFEILKRNGKRMAGWDEILQPELPPGLLIQSWRGPKALSEAVAAGHEGILSNGYYLDLMYPASQHYLVDPIDENAAKLAPQQRARILGGESCMWAELISPETVDSRIWPRNAAIAERLWSAAEVKDVDDMYRRLDIVSQHLEWWGLRHRSARAPMLARLSGHQPTGKLEAFSDLLESLKGYDRHGSQTYTSATPLNRLVDALRGESDVARGFAQKVDLLCADPAHHAKQGEIKAALEKWLLLGTQVQPLLANSPMLAEAAPVADDLYKVAAVGLKAVGCLEIGATLTLSEPDKLALADAAKPKAAVMLMILPSITKLVSTAGGVIPE